MGMNKIPIAEAAAKVNSKGEKQKNTNWASINPQPSGSSDGSFSREWSSKRSALEDADDEANSPKRKKQKRRADSLSSHITSVTPVEREGPRRVFGGTSLESVYVLPSMAVAQDGTVIPLKTAKKAGVLPPVTSNDTTSTRKPTRRNSSSRSRGAVVIGTVRGVTAPPRSSSMRGRGGLRLDTAMAHPHTVRRNDSVSPARSVHGTSSRMTSPRSECSPERTSQAFSRSPAKGATKLPQPDTSTPLLQPVRRTDSVISPPNPSPAHRINSSPEKISVVDTPSKLVLPPPSTTPSTPKVIFSPWRAAMIEHAGSPPKVNISSLNIRQGAPVSSMTPPRRDSEKCRPSDTSLQQQEKLDLDNIPWLHPTVGSPNGQPRRGSTVPGGYALSPAEVTRMSMTGVTQGAGGYDPGPALGDHPTLPPHRSQSTTSTPTSRSVSASRRASFTSDEPHLPATASARESPSIVDPAAATRRLSILLNSPTSPSK
jgi:hypothetical protein